MAESSESKWRTNLLWCVGGSVGGFLLSQMFGYLVSDWSVWRKEKDVDAKDAGLRIVKLETLTPTMVDAIARVEKQQQELKSEVKEGFDKLEEKLDRFMAVAQLEGVANYHPVQSQHQTVTVVTDRLQQVRDLADRIQLTRYSTKGE